jgi:hypothetical protein
MVVASSLAAALLGGDSGNAGIADPAILAAMPQMQLGQGLVQQGLSTAPAYPMQAVARLAQTLAGGYLQHDAVGSLAKAYAHSAENAAKILPEDSPVRKMLQSGDPGLVSMGMQILPKVQTLASEPANVGPGDNRYVGGTMIAANTRPRDKLGIIQEDLDNAARAQAAAGPSGRAPPASPGVPLNPPRLGGIEGMGPGSPGVPLDGPRLGGVNVSGQAPPVPLTGPRFSIPNSAGAPVPLTGPNIPNFNDRFSAARPTGAPATSPPLNPLQGAIDLEAQRAAAEESAKNPALIQRAGGIAAAENPALIERAVASEAAKNPALAQRAGMVKQAENAADFGNYAKEKPAPTPGPGGTDPVEVWHRDPMTGTSQKTVIPALNDQGTIDRSPAALKENVPAWQKTISAWNTGLKASQEADQRLATVEGALKTVQSGWGTTQKAAVNAAAKSLGLPEILPNAKPGDVEKIFHEASIETLKRLQATMQGTGSRIAVAEFTTLTKQGLNPDLQPEANLQMIAEDRGALRQSMDLPRDWSIAKSQYGWENPQAFERAWYDKNGLSQYVNTTKKEIGPLKGMPGNDGKQTAAAPQTSGQTFIVNRKTGERMMHDPASNKWVQAPGEM